MIDHSGALSRAGRVRLPGRVAVLLVALLLASGPAVVACSGDQAQAAGATGAMATMATGSAPAMSDDQPPADAGQAWAARPAFVHTSASTEEAYAYALYHPQVIRWLPCYCGCVGMGHRSNLDCFLKPRATTGTTVFEEHASYCDVCAQTALMAKRLISEGKSVREVRAAIDQTFGGNAPGTHTDLPPS